MPRTFDRRFQPKLDKDPTRFGTAWDDPQSAITEGAGGAGGRIRNNLIEVIKQLTNFDLGTFGERWQNLLDGITEVWTGVVGEIASTVQDAIDAISGIFDTGKTAALSANNANIGVERLKAQLAGGGYDEFDYESANALPGSLYEATYGGPGNGYYGPNGDGFLVWKPQGVQWREVIYRRTDGTPAEDDVVITSVWATPPKAALNPKTYGYICGRMSLVSNATHVRAAISDSAAHFEAVVSGTVTQIGPSKNLTIKNGDVWEMWLGDPNPANPHPRRFWLKQNGTTVLTVEDGAADGTGAVSSIGSGFRQAGIGCRVENYLVVGQNPAPALAGWTWALQSGTGGR